MLWLDKGTDRVAAGFEVEFGGEISIGEEEIEVRVSINRKSGEYDAFRRWKVFADDSRELEFPSRELRMEVPERMDAEGEVLLVNGQV